jgi:hypothetical protein
MLGIMRLEIRCAVQREGNKTRGAINPCRRLGKEIWALEHRAHFVEDAIDTGPIEPDDRVLAETGTVIDMHALAELVLWYPLPVYAVVVPEIAFAEDDFVKVPSKILSDAIGNLDIRADGEPWGCTDRFVVVRLPFLRPLDELADRILTVPSPNR